MNITDTISDFMDKIKEYQLKNGCNTIAVDLRRKTKEFLVNVSVSEVTFRSIGTTGYYIRMEKIKSNALDTLNNKQLEYLPSNRIG